MLTNLKLSVLSPSLHANHTFYDNAYKQNYHLNFQFVLSKCGLHVAWTFESDV
jgi:hypothetical protein